MDSELKKTINIHVETCKRCPGVVSNFVAFRNTGLLTVDEVFTAFHSSVRRPYSFAQKCGDSKSVELGALVNVVATLVDVKDLGHPAEY